MIGIAIAIKSSGRGGPDGFVPIPSQPQYLLLAMTWLV